MYHSNVHATHTSSAVDSASTVRICRLRLGGEEEGEGDVECSRKLESLSVIVLQRCTVKSEFEHISRRELSERQSTASLGCRSSRTEWLHASTSWFLVDQIQRAFQLRFSANAALLQGMFLSTRLIANLCETQYTTSGLSAADWIGVAGHADAERECWISMRSELKVTVTELVSGLL
jgi:hypothetical protein